MDWKLYPNFKAEEFNCSHCGKNEMKPEFLSKLQALRMAYGKPMRITSGYRCPEHPIEARKEKPGSHAAGYAADIAVTGEQALRVIEVALRHGIKRIGVNQKGGGRFIHLDTDPDRPSPAIWSY